MKSFSQNDISQNLELENSKDCGASKLEQLELKTSETTGALCLTDGSLSFAIDYTHEINRLANGVVQRELLVRAARIKGVPHPVVIDATAGCGYDALLLAAAGCNIFLFEKNDIIAQLLNDALLRARTCTNELLQSATRRMHFFQCDSIEFMNVLSGNTAFHDVSNVSSSAKEDAGDARIGEAQEIERALEAFSNIKPDVIYLDPMFPARTKSAATKKKFQLLHSIAKPCDNEEELLNAALSCNPKKIVIKRPIKAAPLANKKPSYSIKGKTVRYDVIV